MKTTGFEREFWARAILTLLVLLVVGCSPDEPPASQPHGPGKLGDVCAKTEDCASGLCVRVDATSGICTTSCASNAECPASNNWTCVKSDAAIQVCACLKLGTQEVCGDRLDNDCDGKIDDCRICNGIPVANDDPNHCGECGRACRGDQTCKFGACTCALEQPTECGGACTDTSSDADNCGSCGTVCGAARVCTDGACVCPDIALPNYCGDVGCVDLAIDDNHCGTCETTCTLARSCQGGSCVCPSGAPQDFCDGVGCVNLQTDNNNCGTCGNPCPSDKVCTQGTCACPTGKTECAGACVDILTDSANCGGCGAACATAQACQGGSCGCTAFGLTVCGDECANLSTSTTHCGACNKACLPGERCSGGLCVCDSALFCSGQCMSTSDNANCGACGNACATGQYCSGGGCVCQGFGLTPCGSSCVNLSSDMANCGVCGRTCPSAQTCSGGSCVCPSSQPNYCSTLGVCVNFSNDASNCGSCGVACSPTQVCSSGTCRCPLTGQVYCPSATACIDTRTSTQHCGACDRACNPTEVCQSGTCRCSGLYDRFCASLNACVDVMSSNLHCGACDVACPAGTHCSYPGVCACDQTGLTNCSGTCYNLTNDPRHCGSCTNSCPGNYTCVNSQCKCPDPTVGTPIRVTNNALDDYRPSVAWDGTHVGVAYAQTIDGGSGTWANARLALLNPDGTVAADKAITSYTSVGMSSGPALVWSGTEYAVVWVNASQNVMFQRLDANGNQTKGAAAIVGTGSPYNPSVAWSPVYGGYAVAFINSGLSFRRLGPDASSPDAVNTVTGLSVSSSKNLVLKTAPDGTWAVASSGFQDVTLTIFNADGSRTLLPQTLGTNSASSAFYPDLVRDSSTWLTAWISGATTNVVVNRGNGANAPANVVSTTTPVNIGEPVLAQVNATLAVGWSQRPSTSGSYTFRMQRFSIPTTASSALTPIHNAIDILATQNTALNDIALAQAGSELLAVWADNRWGATREIYAAPITLNSCP